MLEGFLGAITAIVLNMIASYLYPYFYNLLKGKLPKLPEIPEPSDKEIIEKEPESVEEWRRKNRATFKRVVEKVYFYAFAYIAMYLAFYIPVSFSGNPIDANIDLSHSRLAIDYVINEENLSKISAIFGVLAYAPFWKLSQMIANVVSSIVIRFTFVNEVKYLAFTALSMLLWAFFIAGNVSWALNPESVWLDTVSTSLILWLVLMGVASTRRM